MQLKVTGNIFCINKAPLTAYNAQKTLSFCDAHDFFFNIIIGDITQGMKDRMFDLNYQLLEIGPVNTTIGWKYSIAKCNNESFFKLQGFTESCGGNLTAPEINYNTTSNSITIPSSDLTGTTGEALFFRIIAMDINNTDCSSEKLKKDLLSV